MSWRNNGTADFQICAETGGSTRITPLKRVKQILRFAHDDGLQFAQSS